MSDKNTLSLDQRREIFDMLVKGRAKLIAWAAEGFELGKLDRPEYENVCANNIDFLKGMLADLYAAKSLDTRNRVVNTPSEPGAAKEQPDDSVQLEKTERNDTIRRAKEGIRFIAWMLQGVDDGILTESQFLIHCQPSSQILADAFAKALKSGRQ